MRRTRIVATLGPATRDAAAIRGLLGAGVDVVRLNAAHDRVETHAATAALARAEADRLGVALGVLVDLPGPKMRTGPVAGDQVELDTGGRFELGPTEGPGDARRVATTVPNLAAMAAVGDEIFLADGAIVLCVVALEGDVIVTEVVRGGTLRSRKGIFLPGAERLVDSFTPADAIALGLALDIRADFIGLSFVRSADDVAAVRARLPARGHRPQLVAKIETRAAIGDLSAIVDASDVVMVARGDLGIQVDLSRIAMLQKEIIQVCNLAGTPVITATEMLESMTAAPLPTRAEVADVANAVLDGTDALMLSEETAVGAFPVRAVTAMSDIAVAAESWPRQRVAPAAAISGTDAVAWAVAHAAVAAAEDVGVAAILCPTRTGATPRRVSAFRPRVPVVAIASTPAVRDGLGMTWGVVSCAAPEHALENDAVATATAAARDSGHVGAGMLVAVVAGAPGSGDGATDTVRVLRV